jgi:4-hydroxybenzoate polyprenyltransferase
MAYDLLLLVLAVFGAFGVGQTLNDLLDRWQARQDLANERGAKVGVEPAE